MNLVEYYITKIISEEEINHNGEILVKAKVETNCYGLIEINEHITSKRLWEEEKMQGYYLN